MRDLFQLPSSGFRGFHGNDAICIHEWNVAAFCFHLLLPDGTLMHMQLQVCLCSLCFACSGFLLQFRTLCQKKLHHNQPKKGQGQTLAERMNRAANGMQICKRHKSEVAYDV